MITNVDIMDDWKQFIIKNWICPPDKGMQFTRQKKETVGAPETQGKNQLEVELLYWFSFCVSFIFAYENYIL